MAGMIYQIIELVFGGGLATEVSTWMNGVWETLNKMFDNGLVSQAYSAFSAVGAGLLILYFYMELASKASMDLLTLEKLVVMFIKFLIAFIILINIQDILKGLLAFGNGIYDIAAQNTKENPAENSFQGYLNNHPGDTNDLDKYTGRCGTLMDLLDDTYGGFSNFIKAIGVLIPGLIAYIIMLACKFVCYFVTTKNALDICIRAWMSPIAVPQLFEDGQRSAGVRYIKGFVAATLEMAVIIIILRVASSFSLTLQSTIDGVFGAGTDVFSPDYPQYINTGALEKALSAAGMIPTLLVNIVATGMIAGAGRITHDIVGG